MKDIVFIGNRYDNTSLMFPLSIERTNMVCFMNSRFRDTFICYGRGYGLLINSNKEIDIYNSAKIAINQNNFDRQYYTSDRLWRIMSCGCFCLTKYFKGIETIFKRGIHLDWWETFEELAMKINYYLEHENERKTIAEQGMRYVRNNHTWTHRIKELNLLIGEYEKVFPINVIHKHLDKLDELKSIIDKQISE